MNLNNNTNIPLQALEGDMNLILADLKAFMNDNTITLAQAAGFMMVSSPERDAFLEYIQDKITKVMTNTRITQTYNG